VGVSGDGSGLEPADPTPPRSAALIIGQVVRGSLAAWIPTVGIAWYYSRHHHAPFLNDLGNVSFIMMFVVLTIGGWLVLSPQGRTSQFLGSEGLRKYVSWAWLIPLGGLNRDLTTDEKEGGISSGTVALLVAAQLLSVSLRFAGG
jgi:hypothetical protein